jgi:hypothetical protein
LKEGKKKILLIGPAKFKENKDTDAYLDIVTIDLGLN